MARADVALRLSATQIGGAVIVRVILSFCLLLILTACAGVTRDNAKALGTEGVSATTVLHDQTLAAGKTIGALPEWWAVGDTLACHQMAPGATRVACIKGAVAPAIPAQLAGLQTAIEKRTTALAALNAAYQDYVDFATYDAGAAMQSSITDAVGSINAFSSAAAKIDPAFAALPAISQQFTDRTGDIGGLFERDSQERQLLKASKDLHSVTDHLKNALASEAKVFEILLNQLSVEQSNVYQAFVDVGLISTSDVLTPLLSEVAPGIKFSGSVPAGSADVISAAAIASVQARARQSAKASAQTYDAALKTLEALSQAHAKLEANQSLSFEALKAQVSDIKSLLSDLPSQKPKPSS